MIRRNRFYTPLLPAAAGALLAASGTASALTYHISYLEDEGRRAQITQVMDEAVAVYNSTTNFNVDVNVIYHSGIPTAQSDYNGQLGFGGSISTQVAIHEIAHYLGSGTTNEWGAQFAGNVWNGPALKRYVKLFDGPGAEIYRSGVHYFPYGFNYGNEDSPNARYRIGRIIQAMRMDMGGQDPDGDGMPDEWERYKTGSTALKAGGDADGDGISDFDEWWTDSHPLWVCPVKEGHIYQIRSRLSQMLMEAADMTTGANIRQNPNNGSDLQKWTATYAGGGYWKFINIASGKSPDVFNFSLDAGANVVAWDNTGGTNQQWRIFPGPSGAAYWKLGNRNSTNMVMDVNGGNNATGPNTNIGQFFDDPYSFNEEWMFDDVTPGVLTGGLVANYKLEGNPRDFSGRSFHGKSSGGVSYTAGRVGGLAATFNGINGSISMPASVERNFSLACWVKTTATAGSGANWYNGMAIIDGDVPGVAKDFGLAMLGNKAAFGIGNPELTITSAAAINDGNWHHLAATLNTDTGTMKLYVDGFLSASGTGPAGARSAPADLHLGSSGGGNFLDGTIDEARLYNQVLTQQEIARLADSSSALVASYSFDGNARDGTLFGNHGDAVGATYTAGKVGSQALQLSGSASFAKIPASVTRDFTVAYWVKTSAVGGIGQWYVGKSMVDADVPGIANDWGISVVGNHAAFGIGNGGAGTTIESSSNINDGAWHHIAATRVNATGAMSLYVDGTLQATGTGSTALRDAPGGIRVGSTLFGGSFLTGTIDELKIYDYPLTAAEVTTLAATSPGEIWRLRYFRTAANTGNAADGADPDYDGTINLLERAFARDPNVPDTAAATPQAANDGTFLTLTYQRSLAATDLQFQAEWSNDLATWQETGVTDSLISTGPTTETRAAKVPLAGMESGPVFLRLRVR